MGQRNEGEINWVTLSWIAVVVFAVIGSVFSPSDPQKDYDDLIKLRGERLQYEAEQQRVQDNIEFRSQVEALKIDMEKNPGRYR